SDFADELRDEQVRTPLCLCAGEGALLYLLGPAVRRFARRQPLRVLVRDAEGTIEAIETGAAQLGVLSGDVPTGFEQELIAEVGFAVAVPLTDPLAERSRTTWSDLRGRSLIAPPTGRPHRHALDAKLPDDVEIAVEIAGWPLTLHLVALGIGVAVVNDLCK